MWASQYWRFNEPYTWVNSGGLGTMGFSIPAAIGAKVGRPDRTVWAIDGDGCFQMTAQELVTASVERIPIKVALLNNSYLGMVRQWQEMFYDERYSEVYLSPDTPDYVRWAEAMGCVGIRVEVARGGRAGDREGQLDQRPPRRRRVPRRLGGEGVPDGSRRRRATTTSSLPAEPAGRCGRVDCDEPDADTTTSCRCSCRTGRACWPASPGLFARRGFNIFSLAVAPAEDDGMSRITIVVDVESAPLEQITKQLFKLDRGGQDLRARPAPVGRARAAARDRAGRRPRTAARSSSWSTIFEAKILAVGAEALTLSLEGHPTSSTTSRSCSTAMASWSCSAPAGSPSPSSTAQRARLRAVKGKTG